MSVLSSCAGYIITHYVPDISTCVMGLSRVCTCSLRTCCRAERRREHGCNNEPELINLICETCFNTCERLDSDTEIPIIHQLFSSLSNLHPLPLPSFTFSSLTRRHTLFLCLLFSLINNPIYTALFSGDSSSSSQAEAHLRERGETDRRTVKHTQTNRRAER